MLRSKLPRRQRPSPLRLTLSRLVHSQYQKLDGLDQFRILVLEPGTFNDNITCRLQVENITKNPGYEAISYVWGDPNITQLIQCGGVPMQITVNLHHGLRHMRYPDRERRLWADAVCINQNDLEERSQQVALMGKIFSSANCTLAWLGEETNGVKGAFNAISAACKVFPANSIRSDFPARRIQQLPRLIPTNLRDEFLQRQIDMRAHGTLGFFNQDWSLMSRLMTRPWFQRKWVVQEVCMAKSTTLLCGLGTLPWVTLENLARYIYSYRLEDHLAMMEDASSVGGALNHVVKIGAARAALHKPSVMNLEYLVRSFRSFQCSDLRDHVYSLHSLAGRISQAAVTPDYTVTEAVAFRNYVRCCVHWLHSIRFLGSKTGHVSHDSGNGSPSWLPRFGDFGNPEDTAIEFGDLWFSFQASGFSKLQASLSEEPDASQLRIRGHLLDRIRTTLTSSDAMLSFSVSGEFILPPGNSLQARHILRTYLSDGTQSSYKAYVLRHAGQAPEDAVSQYSRYISMKRRLDSSGGTPSFLNPEDRNWFFTEALPRFARAEQIMAGRRFCVTEAGVIGHVPSEAREGDEICVLYGGNLLYVLRPLDDGMYLYIGTGFLLDFMDGEAMQMAHVEEREFVLV